MIKFKTLQQMTDYLMPDNSSPSEKSQIITTGIISIGQALDYFLEHYPGIRLVPKSWEYEEESLDYIYVRTNIGGALFLEYYGNGQDILARNYAENLTFVIKDEYDDCLDSYEFSKEGLESAIKSANNYQEEREGIDKELADTYDWLRKNR